MTTALTGGSGVVGGAVLRHLLADGQKVRALARSETTAHQLGDTGAEVVMGEVTDSRSLPEVFDGCETVYHVAGVNEMCSADPDAMYRVNVEGTRNVLRACASAGVRRMIHTSSAATVGEEAGEVATEKTPHRGHYLSEYERSKHHAERVVLTEESPVEVVVVNPSSVQGPGRATGTGEMILKVLQGRLPFLIESDVTLVDIDDCARGHLLAASNGVPGERYLLSGFVTTVSEALDMAAAVLGRRVSARMLPLPVARVGVTIASGVAGLVGRKFPFCPEMVRVISHGHRHDGSKAERDLGLTYTPPAVMIGRMVEWFDTEGLL